MQVTVLGSGGAQDSNRAALCKGVVEITAVAQGESLALQFLSGQIYLLHAFYSYLDKATIRGSNNVTFKHMTEMKACPSLGFAEEA